MTWPLDKSAADVVKLPATGPTPAWAVFDAEWYRARYADAVRWLVDPSDQGLLDYYLAEGQRLSHSPNRWFDEPWYRRAHPAMLPLLESGEVASGMDHYCRSGHCLDRRPHWLFDERLYRRRNPDLTDDVLQDRRLANGYDHYLRNGNREGRFGHALFDAAFFQSQFDPETVRRIREIGSYRYYLSRLGEFPSEPRTTLYFDPDWYVRTYPMVGQSIAAGTYRSALEHYLCNDTPERFDPLSDFSEAWYRGTYSDVALAIEQRQIRNGYVHFLLNGARESRTPSAAVDLKWYAQQEPARVALERREVPDPFAHWLRFGAPSGLLSRPSAVVEEKVEVEVETPPAVHLDRDSVFLPMLGRQGLRFICAGEPAITVVVTIRNDFAALMVTLTALRASFPGDIDLVLVDRGSSDECHQISQYVSGTQLVRFDSPIDERAARNAALYCARAPIILFMAQHARPSYGAIARALHRFQNDATVDLICGLTIAASGMVSDAGGTAWDDGTLDYHARGASPLAPEVNFLRDVDFAPAHFMFGRTEVLTRIGAFDEAAPSLERAAADLGLRLRARDSRVVYDPAIFVETRIEAQSDNTDAHCAAFRERHQPFLSRRTGIPARPTNPTARRVLYIDDSVPLRITGSGFVRSNDVIHAMARMGYAVTVFPVLGCQFNLAAVYADMPETVEVMHDRSLDGLHAFLAERPGYFDAIWVSHTHNLDAVAPILATFGPRGKVAPNLILDTEAIAAERRHVKLALSPGFPNKIPAASPGR